MTPGDGHIYTGPNVGGGRCLVCHAPYDAHPESPLYQPARDAHTPGVRP